MPGRVSLFATCLVDQLFPAIALGRPDGAPTPQVRLMIPSMDVAERARRFVAALEKLNVKTHIATSNDDARALCCKRELVSPVPTMVWPTPAHR